MPNTQLGSGPAPGYGQMQRFPRQAIRQPHPSTMQTNQVEREYFKQKCWLYYLFLLGDISESVRQHAKLNG